MGIDIKVPDIGDFADIPIIVIFVKEGDTIGADDPLVSLGSDKVTMDVPSPQAGVVEKILIKLGDKVSEGAPILTLKGEGKAEPADGSAAAGGGQFSVDDVLIVLESDKATMNIPSPARWPR